VEKIAEQHRTPDQLPPVENHFFGITIYIDATIIFALKNALTGNPFVCIDARKRLKFRSVE